MFPTDRLRRTEAPFVTSAHDGRRRIVAAANLPARHAGIEAGMPLSKAQALMPGLAIAEAEPEADAAALIALALDCLRHAPLVAADPPDGLWIDITGSAHLAGGEAALLADLRRWLAAAGFSARAAVADTPGAAHALARHGAGPLTVMLRVVLPNIRSGILAAFVLGFITSFNQVPVSLFLIGPGINTLPIAMLNYVQFNYDPLIAALSTTLALLSIALVMGMERVLGLSRFV
jgi:hypothetical protein